MNTFEQERRLAFCETIGSVFWFAMDGAWLLEWQLIAFIMAVPAAICNLLTFRYTPRKYNDMAITGAMNTWLAMNALWIIADLKNVNWLVLPAKISLFLGIALLVSVGLRSRSAQTFLAILRRFRRLRLRKT